MELLINIVDNPSSKLLKAGDVIWYAKDGHEWGVEEVKNKNWRIVSVPGMTEQEALALVMPELPPTLDKQYPDLQPRAMKLDLIQLDTLAKGAITADATAKAESVDALKNDSDLRAFIKANAVDAVVDKFDLLRIATVKPPVESK